MPDLGTPKSGLSKAKLFAWVRFVCSPCTYVAHSKWTQLIIMLILGAVVTSFSSRAGTRRALHRKRMFAELAKMQRWTNPTSEVQYDVRVRDSSEPYCALNSEIFPGAVHDHTNTSDYYWEPEGKCRLKRFTTAEARACTKNINIAFYGDSLMDDLSSGFATKIGAEIVSHQRESADGLHSRINKAHLVNGTRGEEVASQFFWTHSVFALDPTNETMRPNASQALRAADVAVLHHSTWDMGLTCQGLFQFYSALTTRLQRMREVMKPGARLVLYDLHWIWNRRCLAENGPNAKCFKCNKPARARGYRAALHLAAACAGAEMFSTAELYKHMPAHTNDGIHYESSLWSMESDVLLNGLCHRGDTAPMTFNTGTCNQRAAMREWRKNTEAVDCTCLISPGAKKKGSRGKNDPAPAVPPPQAQP
eukprot:TRINITY_DN43889_c0_g1_i1.p1 TRINITY_DN43889_c0_g1~~TRINITY_DN43889_c0_g1_i1.p1  ORF type:complete len:442 (+),score=119.20 TRINITY_DN43889_c0_g1_i1:65-1327(+)